MNPTAHNPGVNAAISDPPPDMKLKPPMRGEVDHQGLDLGNKTRNRRGSTMVDSRIGSWKKPNALRAERSGNKFSSSGNNTPRSLEDKSYDGRALTRGDLVKGRNPNY